ncbi:MAG: RraA family protein [Dehalococcoidales bacterium]|nr:RraA family protein [Dehalococcoidales bacterium]
MPELSEKEMLEKLRGFDTPSITNIVATYPTNPLCLGLYEPWRENWYTDQSVRCPFPELGARIGYAVTVAFALPNPSYKRWSIIDLFEIIASANKPSILVIKQEFPPEIQPKVGLAGGQMTTALKACGVVGVVTNGPTRDIDEIRPLEIQYLTSGVTPGHGEMAISAINVPVSVAAMDVAPGEIVHMDENGAVKFPADKLADICQNIDAFTAKEKERAANVLASKTFAQIKAAWKREDLPG